MGFKKAVFGLSLFVFTFSSVAGVITFDDYTTGDFTKIIDSYHGFTWNNMYVVRGAYQSGTGYERGVVSGDYAAFNGFGDDASMLLSSDTEFDFNGAYFTGALRNVAVTISGFRNGAVVYQETIGASNDVATWFDLNMLNIDQLSFSSKNSQFVMDNFTYNRTTSVPEPGTLSLLLVGSLALFGFAWKKRG